MFSLQKKRTISKTAVTLKAVFFLLSVIFLHPTVSFTDRCLVHSFNDIKELGRHAIHVSEHLSYQKNIGELETHIEESEEQCVGASSSFIQSNGIKSPALKAAFVYVLAEVQTSDCSFELATHEITVKNAPSQHLAILRSIVVII